MFRRQSSSVTARDDREAPIADAGAECLSQLARLEWRPLVPLAVFTALAFLVTKMILGWGGYRFYWMPDRFSSLLVMQPLGVVLCSAYVFAPQIGRDLIEQLRGATPTSFQLRVAHLVSIIVSGWILVLIFAAVLLAHSNLKPAILLLNPRDFDGQLEAIERALCGGILPTEWIVSHSSATALRFWEFVYGMFPWFPLVSLMIALHFEGVRGGARLVLAMSIGLFITLAIVALYPTRGPLFVHPEWFDAKIVPSTVLRAQVLLISLEQYAADPPFRYLFGGIAALPSFHVIAWVCSLWFWKPLPRWLIAIGLALVLLNWISTFALGWHYALDGVLGVPVALIAVAIASKFIPSATPATPAAT